MKRFVLSLFIALLAVVFALPAFSAQKTVASGAKSLIVYYSLSGNTKLVAETLQGLVGADILEITPVQPYPDDFHAVVEQARKERRTNFLPPLKPIKVNLQDYEIIYLGFPIWGSTLPQPMATFLSQNALDGKTIIPFCTHDGYGAGRSVQAIAEYCPQATMLAGFDMLGADVREAKEHLAAWLNKIGVDVVSAAASKAEGTPITIALGDTVLRGVLHNGPVAEAFKKTLPVTVDMGQFGGREFYGSLSERIATKEEGQLRFENGDITYCPQNNTVAIFYAQTDRSNLTMRVIPMGKVLSSLSAFATLPRNIRMTFSLSRE